MIATIKAALENVVLCRGAHGPKESYEYAEKMEHIIKAAVQQRLRKALTKTQNLEEELNAIIEELN